MNPLLKIACILFLLGASVISGAADQWWSNGGIVPFAYDPYNEGKGATVWVENMYTDTIPVDGMTAILYDKYGDFLGSVTLHGDKDAVLMYNKYMPLNVGIIPGARSVRQIVIESRNVWGDDLRSEWYIEGNIEQDLANLPFDRYIDRQWVKVYDANAGDTHILDTYTVS